MVKKQKNNKKKRSRRGGEGRGGHCLLACHWLPFVKATLSLTHDSLILLLCE